MEFGVGVPRVTSWARSPGLGRREVSPAAGVAATAGPLGPGELLCPPLRWGSEGAGRPVPSQPGLPLRGGGPGDESVTPAVTISPGSTLELARALPRGVEGTGRGASQLLISPTISLKNVNRTNRGSACAIPAPVKAKGPHPPSGGGSWLLATPWTLCLEPGERRWGPRG